MSPPSYIFIAREITVSGRGSIRIDEEGVFSSFEKAEAFLESLRDEEYYDLDSDDQSYYRHEIVKIIVNSNESWDDRIKWIFKINGDLIAKIDSKDDIPIPFKSVSYKGLFQLGDIIRVKSNFEEANSYLIRSNYGVIGKVPILKKDWEATGKPAREWDGAYIIWLISPDTHLLYHEHINEVCLESFTKKLPEDLDFLNLVSKFFKGEKNIPEAKKVEEAFSENIVVRKINYFYDKSR